MEKGSNFTDLILFILLPLSLIVSLKISICKLKYIVEISALYTHTDLHPGKHKQRDRESERVRCQTLGDRETWY